MGRISCAQLPQLAIDGSFILSGILCFVASAVFLVVNRHTTNVRRGAALNRELLPAGQQPPSPDPLGYVAQDRELVERCLAGEVSAWSQLYTDFHGSLVVSIRRLLGRSGNDHDLSEELAARVWYALIKNRFALLSRFDAERKSRLSTFFAVLARAEVRGYLRSERRRKMRERASSRLEADREASGEDSVRLADDDFLALLTPAERAFYCAVLTADAPDGSTSYSPGNRWQLSHRIRKKLERYLLRTT